MGTKGLEGTFAPNKQRAIHRWFAYMEGYSEALVERELELIGYDRIHTLYDPFAGSGTSLLTASQHNIAPYYSEINPVMRFVCDAKINAVKRIKESPQKQEMLKAHYRQIEQAHISARGINDYQGFEKFYTLDRLSVLLQLLRIIDSIPDDDVKNVCRVALAAITTQVSNMVRRGDLRYAKGNEKAKVNQDVQAVYLEKLRQIQEDIADSEITLYAGATKISEDSRDNESIDLFDCVVTSPPYLNGTNYIRNTKLELKLLGFIDSEADLPPLHSRGIIAGINSVSRRNKVEVLPVVQPYFDKLTPAAYDKRIPVIVAGYFYDMEKVILKLHRSIKPNGYFIMDIGDSVFSGIHIPTHELLEQIAAAHGFKKYGEEILRIRHSNDGTKLTQRVLRFTNAKEQ